VRSTCSFRESSSSDSPRRSRSTASSRSSYQDGVIAVSSTVTLIATDPRQARTAEAIVGGVVS
jgi:hypothetical protein